MTGPVRVATNEGRLRATPVKEQRKVMFDAPSDIVVIPPSSNAGPIPRVIPFVIGA